MLSLTLALSSMVFCVSTVEAKKHQSSNELAQVGQQGELPQLNASVLQFAQQNLGKQVGNGECWTLAAAALESAGAQPPDHYVFGKELSSKEAWLPGDIMQFKSCHFEESSPTSWSEFDLGWPNHTAIIQTNDNGRVTILHQNFAQNRTVQTLTIDMHNLKSGSFKVFRPIASETNPNSSSSNKGLPYMATSNQSFAGNESLPPVAPAFAPYGSPTSTTNSANLETQPRHHHRIPRFGENDGITNGALGENLQLSDGPLYQERAQVLERIRQLQVNGDNARFPLQLFQKIDETCRQIQQSQGQAGEESINAVRGQIAQLHQIISARASQLQHHMQP